VIIFIEFSKLFYVLVLKSSVINTKTPEIRILEKIIYLNQTLQHSFPEVPYKEHHSIEYLFLPLFTTSVFYLEIFLIIKTKNIKKWGSLFSFSFFVFFQIWSAKYQEYEKKYSLYIHSCVYNTYKVFILLYYLQYI